MTRDEVSRRPEFQRLHSAAESFSSALRLVTRVYGVDLNIIDPRTTASVVAEHALDEINKREALAKLSRQERQALGFGKD